VDTLLCVYPDLLCHMLLFVWSSRNLLEREFIPTFYSCVEIHGLLLKNKISEFSEAFNFDFILLNGVLMGY
jgi:hypothetical protein